MKRVEKGDRVVAELVDFYPEREVRRGFAARPDQVGVVTKVGSDCVLVAYPGVNRAVPVSLRDVYPAPPEVEDELIDAFWALQTPGVDDDGQFEALDVVLRFIGALDAPAEKNLRDALGAHVTVGAVS